MLSKIWNFLIDWHRTIHISRNAASLSYRGKYVEATEYIKKSLNDTCAVVK